MTEAKLMDVSTARFANEPLVRGIPMLLNARPLEGAEASPVFVGTEPPIFVQPISERERGVLSLVAEGYTNRDIADNLDISERTVKSHLTNIMTKLRASDRTHAVVTAIRLGWLRI